MNNTKNDHAWQQLFEKYHIAEKISKNGFFEISSTKINEFREARLMTKFDHKSQLPKLFVDNGLAILPVSRGDYLISKIKIFKELKDTHSSSIYEKVVFPNNIETLDYKNITSESTAINCAYVTGIIEDFTNEDKLYPTVSGRMSSSSFDFYINSENGDRLCSVKNSQLEIDGGYEGNNSLNLIEAKNYLSDDFLIRQLYYPYRLWESKVKKRVRNIFLTYSNGVFYLREFSFSNKSHYNSLELVNEKKYVISEGDLNIEIIQYLLKKVTIVEEPEVAFPQADSFDRVINLCELLKQKTSLSKEEITNNYDFDSRQTNYYTDAARYLGLVNKLNENGKVVFVLSNKGETVFETQLFERQKIFVELILSHKAFKETIELYLQNGEMPHKAAIVDIMKSSNLYNVNSLTTYNRRASTVSSWINWIINLVQDY